MVASQRYDWADFMKGVLMFLVILYHSEVYYGPGHTWSWVFEPFFYQVFSLSVDIFSAKIFGM